MILLAYIEELISLKLAGFLLTHFTMIANLAPWAWIDSLEPYEVSQSGPNGLKFEKVRVYLSLWTTQLDELTDEEYKNIWQTIRICMALTLVFNIVEYLGINVWAKGDISSLHHAFLAVVNALALLFLTLSLSIYAINVDDMFAHLHTYDETLFGTLNDDLEKMYFLAGPISGLFSVGILIILTYVHVHRWWYGAYIN